MSVQMTIRVDDDLAAFVDEAAKAGGRSRAEVIGNALRREVRRRAAARDAQIYASTADLDLEDDTYLAWTRSTTTKAWADLD